MAPRRCTAPGCRTWTTTGRCLEHTTGIDDYGAAHRQARARWAPIVATGNVPCARCGDLIDPDHEWDLDHDDEDRTRYLGPSHADCNRSTA